MHWIFRIIWMIFWRQKGREMLFKNKAKGVLFYLKTLNVTRKTLFVVIAATLVLHVFVLALVGTVVTGTLLLIDDWRNAVWLLFIMFSIVSTAMVASTCFLFSQRLWYRMSGAKGMVENLEKEAS